MRSFIYLSLVLLLLISCSDQEVVNVYSSRHYEVDNLLLERFSARTGIRVNLVKADSDQLVARLEAEGERSRADVLITADASRLLLAKERGLLRRMESEVVEKVVPEHWRDSDMYWTGLTKRARVIVYDPSRTDISNLGGHENLDGHENLCSYENLASEEWRGRVLVRSSNSHYNQTLMASIIAAHGEQGALEWADGVVENMAREPRGNDRDQVKFIAAGLGDVAVVNSYYMGLLHNSQNSEERNVAAQMKILFPNQAGRGTHVNMSGAGLTASATNVTNGIRLIEFLLDKEVQEEIASKNYEYPVVEGAKWPEMLLSWGSFREDTVSMETLAGYREQAMIIFNRAGWR